MVNPSPDTPDLSRIKSEAILWIIRRALAGGNELADLADWSKALVAHMRDGLPPAMKAEIEAHWPQLQYYREARSPHMPAHEGYTDQGFAIWFPRPH